MGDCSSTGPLTPKLSFSFVDVTRDGGETVTLDLLLLARSFPLADDWRRMLGH